MNFLDVFIIDEICILSAALVVGSIMLYLSHYATLTNSPIPVWLTMITFVRREDENANLELDIRDCSCDNDIQMTKVTNNHKQPERESCLE